MATSESHQSVAGHSTAPVVVCSVCLAMEHWSRISIFKMLNLKLALSDSAPEKMTIPN